MNNKIPCNTHELKILPKWFEDVQTNKKNFEIRKNDRNFEVGDYLILKEWHRGKFTDRYVIRQIEYIYKGDGTYGLTEDYCVLGLKVPQAEKQWIPCSERLPEEGQGVMVPFGDKIAVCLAQDNDGTLREVTSLISKNAPEIWLYPEPEWGDGYAAWMPLPEPMKVGE